MRTSILLVAFTGLSAVAACGDDDVDSFEGSYARAACERKFDCYPEVRRNYRDDIDMCMGALLANRQWRADSYGAECAEAALYQWACEGQAICNTESDLAGPCGSALTRVRTACPDAAQ